MKDAGKVVPIAEILKAHRTYDLYHKYQLFNIEFADVDLEASYHDQLLCSLVSILSLPSSLTRLTRLATQGKRLRM